MSSQCENHYYYDLSCDICNSHNITNTSQGFVCRDCGIVLNIDKLVYNRPIKIEKIQHNTNLETTTIGSKSEIRCNYDFKRLIKVQHQCKTVKQTLHNNTKREINRLITSLQLNSSLKNEILKNFTTIYNRFEKGTKFQNPEKLIPIVLYYTCKMRDVIINQKELLEISNITKKEYNKCKLIISQYFNKYQENNRIKYVLHRIFEFTETYHLEMRFFHRAKALLSKLWNLICLTKDDLICSIICSVCTLCYYAKQISILKICRHFTIAQSAIQYQIKNKIFSQLKLTGFTSLVKSGKLIRNFVRKLFSQSKRKKILKKERAKIQIKVSKYIKFIQFCFKRVNYWNYKIQLITLFYNYSTILFFILIYPKSILVKNKAIFTGKGPPIKSLFFRNFRRRYIIL